MKLYCDLGSAKQYHGDCRVVLPTLAENSVDSIVTDPPYHLTMTNRLAGSNAGDVERNFTKTIPGQGTNPFRAAATGFMGKKWDGGDVAFKPETWAKAMRLLKPGGYLLAFGGTRTYHRLVCAIEDAGFEIRDQIGWVFGSGFPKSHNLHGDWEGWGTALKPAWEPICVARKPFSGTVAENVLQYGTRAINIAGCRIEGEPVPINRLEKWSGFGQEKRPDYEQEVNALGRWPANIIHDGSDEVLAAFPETSSGAMKAGTVRAAQDEPGSVVYGTYGGNATNIDTPGDSGSAARFFYCAKAGREDRNEGCEQFEPKPLLWSSGEQSPGTFKAEGTDRTSRNAHPTVKPTDLMRYLCRLVTPPNGTILDPFSGSGSTGKAALYEGFNYIGIEGEEEYCAIAKARMEFVLETDSPLLRAAMA